MTLRVGELEIDGDRRLVHWAGRGIDLGARAFDVLFALAERQERVVSKNELLDVAWQGLVVEENNLTVQISALRKVFGPQAIRTITGRGYRLALDHSEAPPMAAVPPEVVRAVGNAASAHTDPVFKPSASRLPAQPEGDVVSRNGNTVKFPGPVTPIMARLPRRLVAHLLASVAGWSRLYARQDRLAVAAWRQLRTELLEPTLAEYGAQTEELTPERICVAFDSAVDAVQWALHVVENANKLHSAGPQPLFLRIAIVTDDAIVDDGKLLGMGAQAVAALHALAQHGEVVIDDVVRALIVDKVSALCVPLEAGLREGAARGAALWLMRTETPRREVVAEQPAGTPTQSHSLQVLSDPNGQVSKRAKVAAKAAPSALRIAPADAQAGSLPAIASLAPATYLPTLAVLPLQNLGTDSDAHLALGLTEQVINYLALNKSLAVIAHNSTLTYAGQTVDPAEVALQLGAQYVLSGTLARVGAELQIDVSLLRVKGGSVVLKRPFRGQLGEVFEFQDRLAADMAAAVDPEVVATETRARLHHPTIDPSAYECLLQGFALKHAFGHAGYEAAGAHFRRALELDPNYGQAHAQLGWWHAIRVGQQQATNLQVDRRLALEHSQRAVELDPRDATSLAIAAHLQSYLCKRYAEAQAMFKQALSINPSCTLAWARSASTLAYIGQGEAALAHVQQAIRLSPNDPDRFTFYTTRGTAALVLGRYDEAAAWLGQSHRLNPGFVPSVRLLVAALVLAGERPQAQALAEDLLVLEPSFSVSEFGRWYPLCEPWLGSLLQALREAGLPP